MKKIVLRLALTIMTLVLGVLLGSYLLVGFEPIKVALFGPACAGLGWLIYKIDRWIMDDKAPPRNPSEFDD